MEATLEWSVYILHSHPQTFEYVPVCKCKFQKVSSLGLPLIHWGCLTFLVS